MLEAGTMPTQVPQGALMGPAKINRYARYHCCLDAQGHRCWRMKSAAEVRRCRQQHSLLPRMVRLVGCTSGREVWRNGLHQRRWKLLAARVRADRRSFLTTLLYPPLVYPLLPRFDWPA